MKNTLALSPRDIEGALAALSRSPRIALGFEASALGSFRSTQPAWSPEPGEQLPSKTGAYTVLASRALLPGLAWPWLLCSKPSESGETPPFFKPAAGPLARLSRLCFVSAAALCLRPGHSRLPLNERGERLRLISPDRLARAISSRPGAPAPSTLSERLGFARAARARSPVPLRPEISAELASLLRF